MTAWRPERRGPETHDEDGYVLVLIALMLTVLLAMVGFSLDSGNWYRKAAEIQTAADAAALAGVVNMPGDFADAQVAAQRLLARNGVSPSAGHEITVSKVPDKPFQLKVCAADPRARSMFATLVQANPRIARCATAETLLPVSMGSPLNVFDEDHVKVSPAVNGYCTALEDGDLRLSRYRGNRPPDTSPGCPGVGTANPWYDADGYTYVLDLPNGTTGSVQLQVFDATFAPGGGSDDRPMEDNAAITTRFEVWDENRTPYDVSDDVRVSSVTVGAFDGAYATTWKTLYTVPAGRPLATRYRVRVDTLAGEVRSAGINTFGFRAFSGSSFAYCTSEPSQTGYSAQCPNIHGEGEMSIYADSEANPAVFYLGSVNAAHAGKQMVIDLFDPGEGAQSVEILDPNGDPVRFSWATADSYSAMSGSGTLLDTSGTGTPLANRSGDSKFNERLVRLTVDLPADYATRFGDRTWWKIRYRTDSGRATDRTTWAMSIAGAPVRLVGDG